MTIYPAIDMLGGRCVRLQQGDPNKEIVFADDPVRMAQKWAEQGAEWLHIVDLDGAFSGQPRNAEAIRNIAQSVNRPTQLGGGLRGPEQVEAAFDAGIQRVIIGTAVVEQPEMVAQLAKRFPNRVAVGIDARDGFVAARGWRDVTDIPAIEFAQDAERLGAGAIIYTDIGRDGMLTGHNIEATVKIASSVSIPVIGSGGVNSLQDIENAANAESPGIEGLITGMALYQGVFTLREAIETAQKAKAAVHKQT